MSGATYTASRTHRRAAGGASAGDHGMHLNLSADDVLTTTRAVRKRLDLTRRVDPADIRECLDIATQAPTGSNRQNWHFVVLTEPDVIARMGDLYVRAIAATKEQVAVLTRIDPSDPDTYEAQNQRVTSSAEHLFGVIGQVPGMLIPCITGRVSDGSGTRVLSHLGSILPATWSFMLAARNRGIGTVWTTVHLALEEEAAAMLGIPYPDVTQVALIPFGYTIGTDFKRATREPLERVVHWNRW